MPLQQCRLPYNALRRRRLLLAGAAACSTALAPRAFAQGTASFPNKPIRLIVPFAPGGTTDAMARAIGQKLTEAWGQVVIIDNRPGAAGWLGITQLAKSPADGYSVGFTISNIIYAHHLYPKLPFDVLRDFEPVSMISRSAIGLTVAAGFPANTLDEFVALVRKSPGKYNYASFGQGTSANIAGEVLNMQARIDLVHVPYKGAAPMVNDLLGGQVTSAMLDTASMRPLVQAGKIKVLALSGTQRAAIFPSVPTFAELGYKGNEWVGYFLTLAPAGTPRDIVAKLSDGFARAVRSDDITAKLLEFGQEPAGSTAEQLASAMRADGESFGRAIRAANIKVEGS